MGSNFCTNNSNACSISIVVLCCFVFLVAIVPTIIIFYKKKCRRGTSSETTPFAYADPSSSEDNSQILIQELETNNRDLNTQLKEQHRQYEKSKRDSDRSANRLKDLERDLHIARKKANEETQRYNNLLESKIGQDPSFQNLNDKHRPEALVQECKDLCNNLRLDAMDDLEKKHNYDSTNLIRAPARLAMLCYEAARERSEECGDRILAVISDTATELQQPLSQLTTLQIRQELKQRSSDQDIADVVSTVLKTMGLEAEAGEYVEKFVQACARLTWYMVLQSAPIRLLEPTKDLPLDYNFFTLFAECRGERDLPVSMTVWPAVVTDRKGTSDYTVLEKGIGFTVARTD